MLNEPEEAVEVDDVEGAGVGGSEAALWEELIEGGLTSNEPGMKTATVTSVRALVTSACGLSFATADTSAPSNALNREGGEGGGGQGGEVE